MIASRSRTLTRRGAVEVGVGVLAAAGGLTLVTIQQSLDGAQGRTAYNAQAFGGAALLVGGLATIAVGTLEIERGETVRRGASLVVAPTGAGVVGRF